MLSLKLVTAPTIEPVAASDVKLYTRVDSSVEDSLINLWIASARRQAEEYQRRSYITQTWRINLDSFPRLPFYLNRSPVQAITSFKYYGVDNTEYTYSLSDLVIDYDGEPARFTLADNRTFPSLTLRPINSVIITYRSGYGDAAASVPDYIKDAIYLYCAWRYENRTAEESKTPKEFFSLLRPNRIHL
jgi:uncharacterized phiE125 gp8 family phage protein